MDPQQRLLLEAVVGGVGAGRDRPGLAAGQPTPGCSSGVMYHDYGARLRSVPGRVRGLLG